MSEQNPAPPTMTMEGATFDVFRKRERGGVLTKATAAYLVLAIVFYAIFIALSFAALGDYMTWVMSMSQNPGSPPDMSRMMPPQSVLGLIPAALVFTIVYYILFAAYEAACLRWLVRGESGGGLFGLTLGADTWRVYFGYWVWFFLILVVYIAMAVGGVILGMALGASGGEGAAMGVAIFVYMLVCLGALIWIAVRLAPAAACSVALGRFAFFKAWSATRGRFWSLFGAFAFLFIIYIVAVLVIYAIGAFTVMGALFAASMQGDPAAVSAAMTSPATLIGLLIVYGLIIAVAMVFILALYGVNARVASASLSEGRI